ncbi:MAG: hypothetical protein NTZ01_05855 [Verrucomicrobia bacterium]|nr:hypothetical protein [Verrucomicrobiota bacterium]
MFGVGGRREVLMEAVRKRGRMELKVVPNDGTREGREDCLRLPAFHMIMEYVGI